MPVAWVARRSWNRRGWQCPTHEEDDVPVLTQLGQHRAQVELAYFLGVWGKSSSLA